MSFFKKKEWMREAEVDRKLTYLMFKFLFFLNSQDLAVEFVTRTEVCLHNKF